LICDVGPPAGGEEQRQPLGQELDEQQLAGRVRPRQPAAQLQGPLHPRTPQRRDRQLAQPGRHPKQIFRPATGEWLAQPPASVRCRASSTACKRCKVAAISSATPRTVVRVSGPSSSGRPATVIRPVNSPSAAAGCNSVHSPALVPGSGPLISTGAFLSEPSV